MAIYKRVSTLLTIACIVYMCMVSLFHNSLQISNLQPRGYTLNPREHPDLVQEAVSNWTKTEHSNQVKHNSFQKINMRNNLSHSYSNEHDHQQSANQLTRTFRVIKNINATSVRKQPAEYQYILLRKLRERTIEKTQISSEEHTTPEVKCLPDPDTSKVKQYQVDFLTLGDMYVYGAFLDKRYSKGQYARIFVLQPTYKQDSQLLCRFHNNLNRSITVQAEPYEMCENHGRKYGGWIYSCQIPKSEDVDLHTVSLLLIAENRKVFHILSTIPLQSLSTAGSIEPLHKLEDQPFGANIKHPTEEQLKSHEGNGTQTKTAMKIGVCVPPLYGNHCLSKVVNFIEMCRLLGADNIFLYINEIPNDTLSFLQNYTSLRPDILTLVTWDLPIVPRNAQASETNQMIWNHGQLLAIQHCLYANMADFDWLLFLDIDEMLIPKTAGTWPEMIWEAETKFHTQFPGKPLSGISIPSAFFQQDFQTQATNSIDYFQYLHRTKQTSSQRSKMFVRPLLVFELGIHHLSKAISKETRLVTAGLWEGLIHHYRKCVPDDDPNSDLQCEILVKDETILRYEAPLTTASREVLAGAMEFFKPAT